MDREQLEERIQQEVERRRGKAVTLRSVKALLGVFESRLASLHDLFLARGEATAQQKHEIEQGIILDLLCKIDDAVAEAAYRAAEALPKNSVTVFGEIEAYGTDVDAVTGVAIASNAGPVELKPGTRIRASGENVNTVTGLKIGGDAERGDKQ